MTSRKQPVENLDFIRTHLQNQANRRRNISLDTLCLQIDGVNYASIRPSDKRISRRLPEGANLLDCLLYTSPSPRD